MNRLWEILVPCNFNDGTPVRTRHHREWDRQVMQLTGGMTILRPGKGKWRHQGSVYNDRVIPVRLMATDEQMREIAQRTIAHYQQLAVMYYLVSVECHVVEATDKQKARFEK